MWMMIRSGGVGISIDQVIKVSSKVPEHPIPVLLLRANDLRFGAKSATGHACSGLAPG
jgi:hypothetical protein